jgi:hypothetical protein
MNKFYNDAHKEIDTDKEILSNPFSNPFSIPLRKSYKEL